MNRIIIIVSILLTTSCQILKKKSDAKNQFNNITIHANTDISQSPVKGLRVKTKINILSDSIIVSASPILGIEVFRLIITKDTIYTHNKLENTNDVFAVSEMDPKFKLKNIKKLILNTRNRKDTMRYKNKHITTLFTDYVNKQNLFLPQKIIFWIKDTDQKASMPKSINIDYKAIKYYYKQ